MEEKRLNVAMRLPKMSFLSPFPICLHVTVKMEGHASFMHEQTEIELKEDLGNMRR